MLLCVAERLSLYNCLDYISYSPDNGINNCTSNCFFTIYHLRVDETRQKNSLLKKLKSKNDPSSICLVLYTTIGGKFIPGDQHHNSL